MDYNKKIGSTFSSRKITLIIVMIIYYVTIFLLKLYFCSKTSSVGFKNVIGKVAFALQFCLRITWSSGLSVRANGLKALGLNPATSPRL